MPVSFWQGLSAFLFIIVVILCVAIANYDKVRLLIADVLMCIGKVVAFVRRRAVKTSLESTLTTAAYDLNKEIGGLLPKGVTVQWVRQSARDAFIRDDKVVLRMGFEENPDKQLAAAVMQFVSGGFLPRAKPYVDKKVMESSELTLAKRILSQRGPGALKCFLDEVWWPRVDSDEELRGICEILTDIDSDALFVPIFLREIGELPTKVAGQVPTKYHYADTRDFVEFMHRIATQERGSDRNPLDHKGRFIRVAVLLVAVTDKYVSEGVTPYVRRVTLAFENGMERVYLCARGRNIPIAEEVRDEVIRIGVAECIDSVRLKCTFKNGSLVNRACIVLRPGVGFSPPGD
ncbi:MAG: hypothetical protein AB1609_13395 [Bacillota bacterium]